jgi:hypothetical protein
MASYVVCMRLEAVNGVSYLTGQQQLVGVSADLAVARQALRRAAPPDRFEAVLAEVTRIRTEGSVSLLQAMYAVIGKLADGWSPALASPTKAGPAVQAASPVARTGW